MDEVSKRKLDDILAKKPETLSETEKEVLRARRSYLTPSQKRDFADVLTEEEEAPKNLSQMNKAELLAEAAAKGVEVPEGATNKTIRNLLQ
jgi:UTP:GlnB (protein PII) uridylyltransferase